jgi:hypothetical protein
MWGWFAFFSFLCLSGLNSKDKTTKVMSFILVLVFAGIAATLAYLGK